MTAPSPEALRAAVERARHHVQRLGRLSDGPILALRPARRTEMADDIDAVLDDHARLQAENARLKAKVAQLQEALAPFERLVRTPTIRDALSFRDPTLELAVTRGWGSCFIPVSAFSNARAALALGAERRSDAGGEAV